MRLPFGFEISKAKGATSRPRPAQSRGRPSWYRNWGVGRGAWPTTIATAAQLATYDEMRALFPLLEAAINRTVRLVGAPTVTGAAGTVSELTKWMEGVQVNQSERGLGAWIRTQMDQMLTFGFGVGEIVPTEGMRDVYAVTNLDSLTIDLAQGDNALSLRVFQRQSGAGLRVELDPALTLYTVHAPRGRDPYGSSLMRTLPFVASALSTILNATAATWERQGTPSYHVNTQFDPGFVDPDGTIAQAVVDGIGDEFQAVMTDRRSHQIRDFFTSGKVTVTEIGTQDWLTAIQEPFRAFAEQQIAVTELPAWMLGMSWSTTERLSVQQADMIIAYIVGLRREVEPQLRTLLELRQRMTGGSSRFGIEWPAVNLRDQRQDALADAYGEQARAARIENARRMWALGWWTQEQAGQSVDGGLLAVATPYAVPPEGGPGQSGHSGVTPAPTDGGFDDEWSDARRTPAHLGNGARNGGGPL